MAWSTARPPRADAPAKPSRPTTNIRFRPEKSAIRPPRSKRPPKAIVYAVMTHWRLAVEMWSACCAEGKAIVTMEASRTIIS